MTIFMYFFVLPVLVGATAGMWWMAFNYDKYRERPDSQGFGKSDASVVDYR